MVLTCAQRCFPSRVSLRRCESERQAPVGTLLRGDKSFVTFPRRLPGPAGASQWTSTPLCFSTALQCAARLHTIRPLLQFMKRVESTEDFKARIAAIICDKTEHIAEARRPPSAVGAQE